MNRPPGDGSPVPHDRAVLEVGGHEAATALAPGRGLAVALTRQARAVVVPMTLGRDPELAPVAAQTIAWAARRRDPGDLLLARPLGTTTHLVGWLRAAVTRALRGAGSDLAVLLVAPPGRPGDDAELFKVARLVWQYLPVRWVEAAFAGGVPAVSEGVDRCHRLGARDVVLVPAALVPPPRCDGARDAGPLLEPAALAALVRRRADEAELRWRRHGDDGHTATTAHRHHEHGHGHGHHHGRLHDPFPETTETKLKGAAAHGG